MATVSGACSVSKVSGMVHIREDVTPSVLEWKAIDQSSTIVIPLNSLTNLQASKESSPKMMLRILYKLIDGEEKDLRLSFTNRPTMNNIKESLQTIVARSKTVIKDSPTPGTPGTPAPSSSGGTPTSDTLSSTTNPLSFTDPESLTDASLLKNHQLQQKLLLDDRNLRNIFTQSVINFKLSPSIFWSTRLNQLRTYALTISQHRGPYNVLSTIKPVASSDNQVNVNVTRDMINEIFETYPIIKKAFNDLVPQKFQEGEFWSRFFNSKLFRRLRGDKINNSSDRGDVVLDKYLYIDQDFIEREELQEKRKKLDSSATDVDDNEEIHVSKFIDIQGNQEDNSQKLGNMPDVTMRFSDDMTKQSSLLASSVRGNKNLNKGQENEMIILLKNMNKLSSKMVNMSNQEHQSRNKTKKDELSVEELNEFEEELNLHDLNEAEDLKFIRLNINTSSDNKTSEIKESIQSSPDDLISLLNNNVFEPDVNGINLTETYSSKKNEIEMISNEVSSIVKQNFRTFRLVNQSAIKEPNTSKNLIPDSITQEIITYNITIMEFLSHFWKLYLNGNNPNQLKKIFASLKNCKINLNSLKEKIIKTLNENALIKNNEKLKEKLIRDLQSCLSPMLNGLDKACGDYTEAVKLAQSHSTDELNEYGKRTIEQ